MNRPVRIAIGGILFLAASLAVVYFIDPEILGFPGPGKSIATFVKAYNDKDINLMLTVVDSRIERGVNGIGGLLGINSKNVFEIIPMLAAISANATGSTQLENLRIERKSTSGDMASVTATMDEHVTGAQGNQLTPLRILFTVKHEDTGWRIHGMQLIK